jgi:hypothetical protein
MLTLFFVQRSLWLVLVAVALWFVKRKWSPSFGSLSILVSFLLAQFPAFIFSSFFELATL